MKVLVAGASGAIGRPLIKELVRDGHQVIGMSRSEATARKLIESGATAEVVSAFDSGMLEEALRKSQPQVVIDQLTSLPKDPAAIAEALPPARISKEEALAAAGDDAVYYSMMLRGASNRKAADLLGFTPRRLKWLDHAPAILGQR